MKHIKSYKLFESATQTADLSKTKVSKNGKPLTVYHGTKRKFDKFDMSWFGQTDEGFYGRGFYFTTEKEYAQEYGPIIVEAHLDVRNPFWLRTWSTLGSYAELDLRDDLAGLKGMPSDLKTNRNIPNGYYLNRREVDFDDTVIYSVHPKPELYGTDKEEYGPEVRITKQLDRDERQREGYKQMAISDFNDAMSGVDYNTGMANWLLQKFDRNNFTDLLEKNGYDGLFICRYVDNPTIDDVDEILVWDPEKINIIK